MTLYESVVEAYQNALENDYDLDLWTTDQVAIDMMTCDGDLENADFDEVVRAIVKYRGY